MSHPFVYVAALRRTGSTVVAEALSRPPRAFIFREPGLGQGTFHLKDDDRESWRSLGIDLEAFEERVKRLKGDGARVVRAFAEELLPALEGVVRQVGVKEIRNGGWRHLLSNFKQVKVVLTGRDPRDVFVSLHQRVHESQGRRWRAAEEFSAAAVARDLNAEFRHQLELDAAADCLKVRYEDFCTDPAIAAKLLRFVASPLDAPGEPGAFNRSNPQRVAEAELHGGKVTALQVGRWRTERDPEVRAAAQAVAAAMPEYCAFWGYQ